MLKRILFFSLFLSLSFQPFLYSEEPANYELLINGEKHNIALNQEYELKTPSGEQIKVEVKQKEIITYQDDFLSFEHPWEIHVTVQDLGEGVTQLVTSTALGTMILIQEYSNMNPVSLMELMLQETTKESISYGYKMKKENTVKKLTDGTEIQGIQAELTYKQEKDNWAVYATGAKDKGIIIITRINELDLVSEGRILALLWQTLKLRFS